MSLPDRDDSLLSILGLAEGQPSEEPPPPEPDEEERRRRALRVQILASALVFASSTCIMILELVAARLVAQNLGASLYTWTSVIGVILAGISVGNWIGGRLADRHLPGRVLPILFLIASLLSFSVLWLNVIADQWTRPEPVSWPIWVLINVTFVFLLPAATLGTIGPVVAKMALDECLRTGSTVGNIYAWAAVGSIFGTFLTGFVLIDVLGTRAIVTLVAVGLAVLGLALGLRERRSGAEFVAAWLALLLGMSVLAFGPWSRTYEWGVFLLLRVDDRHLDYYDESNYFAISVYEASEWSNAKILALDNLVHSFVPTDDLTRLIYEYEQVYASITEHVGGDRRGPRAMFIGGGGFVFPRYLERVFPNPVIHVAEIDPAVKRAARQALQLPPDDQTAIQTFTMDARNFVDDRLQHDPQPYDFVYGDAFNDLSVPWHLTTREFNEKIRRLLKPNGVYMINIIDIYREGLGRFLGAWVATAAQTFPNVYVFSSNTDGPTDERDTFVVACSPRPLPLHDRRQPADDLELPGQLFAWLENGVPGGEMQTVLERARGIILTDDYAPVENLLAPVYQAQ